MLLSVLLGGFTNLQKGTKLFQKADVQIGDTLTFPEDAQALEVELNDQFVRFDVEIETNSGLEIYTKIIAVDHND